jgi:hypothetical protein
MAKNENPNQWVFKIDLNNYSNIFEEHSSSLNLDKLEKIVIAEILNLHNELDIKLLQFSLQSSGNICILFDGFDEVARDYKEIVLEIIKAFTKNPKIKVFVSTRMEWQEELQKNLNGVCFQLKPFDETDQIKYLKQFLKTCVTFDEDQLEEFSHAILEKSSESVTKKEEALTGIPLIIKLVGELVLEKTRDKYYDEALLLIKQEEEFSLHKLFENFIDKMIERHLIEKSKMDPTNVRVKNTMKNEKKLLKKLHGTHALRVLFNLKILKMFPKWMVKPLTDIQYDNIINCGIIAKVNNQYVAIHFTFIEHFVAETLTENLDDDRVADVVVNKVLVEDGYKVVRMFINNQIRKVINSESLRVCQEIIGTSKNAKALCVVAEEGNAEIFEFLLNSLMAESEVDSKIVQQILKSTFEGSICFFYYFHRCDPNMNMLQQLKDSFCLNFVREIFTFVNSYKGTGNLIIAAAWSGKNYVNLFEWILQVFKDDTDFLKELFMSVDQGGDGIVSNALFYYDEKSFNKLLEILENVKFLLGEEFFLKLIQLKNYDDQIFFLLRETCAKCDLIPVFDWLKKMISDEKTLREIICLTDYQGESLLHKYSKYCDESTLPKVIKEFLNWTRTEFGAETAENLILHRSKNEKTFVDLLLFRKDPKENFSALNEILRILLDDFCVVGEFFKELIFKQGGEVSWTLLHYYTRWYRNKSELCEALKEFLSLVCEHLGKETLVELISVRDKYGHTFLYYIVLNDNEN